MCLGHHGPGPVRETARMLDPISDVFIRPAPEETLSLFRSEAGMLGFRRKVGQNVLAAVDVHPHRTRP